MWPEYMDYILERAVQNGIRRRRHAKILKWLKWFTYFAIVTGVCLVCFPAGYINRGIHVILGIMFLAGFVLFWIGLLSGPGLGEHDIRSLAIMEGRVLGGILGGIVLMGSSILIDLVLPRLWASYASVWAGTRWWP
jgi:hypothetical protein